MFGRALDSPLRSDHNLSMESANQGVNDTKGLLADLPLKIGNHTFFVQAQVVDDASYEMLLGRPFHTLTQASTRHFRNGDAHLTLVDPNTQAVITIPTHARVRTPHAGASSNFFAVDQEPVTGF